MSFRPVASVAMGALVVGCGNFFPNPNNVALPSGFRNYELDCGGIARGLCEARAAKLVEEKRLEQPTNRVVKIRLDDDRGSYSLTFADGTEESLIVD
ncbi:MAG: hypothetical protein ACJ765_13085 [Chloroflexota bacterium]